MGGEAALPDEAKTAEPAAPEADAESSNPAPTRRISRRSLLATTGVGIAGLTGLGAVLGLETGHLPGIAPAAPPTHAAPSPTPAPQRLVRHYRSRPDLTNPRVSVASPALGSAPGLVLLTPGGGPGPIIVDDHGEAVWIRQATGGLRAINLRAATYRGEPVLTWWEGAVTNAGVGQGEYVIVDAAYREVVRVRAGNGLQGDLHEFILTPSGTALFTAYAPRPSAEADAAGHTGLLESIVQEVDVASGRIVFEWHSGDHVSMDESYDPGSAGQPFDYFHVNSIDVDTDGNLLLSARHTWAVYKIDRTSGSVIWRLGGKRSDFAMGNGAAFAWQHDARRQRDGTLTLFDDGSNGSQGPESRSRGIVLRLDEPARTATLAAEYVHPAGLLSTSQGSVQVLPNGNVFVGWGSQPVFSEFAASGDVRFDAHCTPDMFSYRAFRFPWTGNPAEPPAIAVQSGGDSTLLFASWNGSTEVATWVAVAGDSPDALMPVSSSPRRGFETTVVVPGQPAFVAAEARDGSGATLARSRAVKT